MRYILILLLFPTLLSAQFAQDFRYRIIGDSLIYTYSDTGRTAMFNKESYSIDKDFEIRKIRVGQIVKYIKALTTPTQYNTVRSDVRNLLIDYMDGSDALLSWVKGENSAIYGNFTLIGSNPLGGFPDKAYFTAQRKRDLLNILQ